MTTISIPLWMTSLLCTILYTEVSRHRTTREMASRLMMLLNEYVQLVQLFAWCSGTVAKRSTFYFVQLFPSTWGEGMPRNDQYIKSPWNSQVVIESSLLLTYRTLSGIRDRIEFTDYHQVTLCGQFCQLATGQIRLDYLPDTYVSLYDGVGREVWGLSRASSDRFDRPGRGRPTAGLEWNTTAGLLCSTYKYLVCMSYVGCWLAGRVPTCLPSKPASLQALVRQ